MKAIDLYGLVVLNLLLISVSRAAPPLFLSAITSALATIPFTGGPMTTGLMGAKLAVGTKLLYYLGYFGRKAKPKSAPAKKPAKSLGQPGFQQGFNQQSVTDFEQYQLFEALTAQGIDPNTAMQLVNGGFGQNVPQGGGGFGLPNVPQGGGFGSFPVQGGGFGSFPVQGGGFGSFPGQGGGFGSFPNQGSKFGAQQVIPAQGFPGNPAFGPQGGFPGNPAFSSQGANQGFGSNNQGLGGHPNFAPPEPFPSNFQPNAPGFDSNVETDEQSLESDDESQEGSEDIESFFKFLTDMDDNSCISRLVCDIGQDPTFLGDFSENIFGIVNSLDVQPSSGAYPYVKIMESGKNGGNCAEKFPDCSDSAYEIVKNVAPSVGVPDNIDPTKVNKL